MKVRGAKGVGQWQRACRREGRGRYANHSGSSSSRFTEAQQEGSHDRHHDQKTRDRTAPACLFNVERSNSANIRTLWKNTPLMRPSGPPAAGNSPIQLGAVGADRRRRACLVPQDAELEGCCGDRNAMKPPPGALWATRRKRGKSPLRIGSGEARSKSGRVPACALLLLCQPGQSRDVRAGRRGRTERRKRVAAHSPITAP